ncbi:hypothetical protein [Janthinobacterium psychrotolerans]|uniref:DUF2946 family protein n=1 Tax=Janthinobacterium psychrotolerans TaxID=1747903 RepID=A0A1A7C8X6_9BURK|nr:hypothetical protein [Janthinobacterium psychrotolerans]OBV41225.1 hypothetical protein ASR47_102635 [Janthinobacterium psychrotolerans]
MSIRQPSRQPRHKVSAPARTPWQLCVALFSALALVLLLSTAASHLHKTSLDAEECTLCATVIDKVADIAVPPGIAEPPAQLLPYRLLAVLPAMPAPVIALLLPPVRGPPSTSL